MAVTWKSKTTGELVQKVCSASYIQITVPRATDGSGKEENVLPEFCRELRFASVGIEIQRRGIITADWKSYEGEFMLN